MTNPRKRPRLIFGIKPTLVDKDLTVGYYEPSAGVLWDTKWLNPEVFKYRTHEASGRHMAALYAQNAARNKIQYPDRPDTHVIKEVFPRWHWSC